ncbi:lamin tail domain-containing protein [Paenibacillus glycinis]|uniref:LTD domain-containing protein n=1 Tax=Paenibacillus glycinis TaxID=2697035 RepID=A0ABW9XT54_9BACL|nr:lamin tail domain-containing protein [Paenibacillus glycinis]NBD25716.1 hypothetical protein [Paenibacillus glycinis]
MTTTAFRRWTLAFGLLIVFGACWIAGSRSAFASAENPPTLLLTEAMIQSPGTNEPYRYLEIYNNTDRTIDLADYKLMYYYQPVASNPWSNSAAGPSDIISAGRATDMYIHPYSTKIVWLLSDATKTVADFNAAYGTSLDASQFVYTQGSGWAYASQRYLAIVKAPYGQDADRITFIRYNSDAGTTPCTQGVNCDFAKGESVDYFYPSVFNATSREMERIPSKSLHKAPTPGAVSAGQVPAPPGKLLITEAMIQSPGTNEPYRYIEVYNNSGQAINLAEQKLLYYYQAVSSEPWNNSASSAEDIISAGRATDMNIQPYSTKIIWLLSDPTKTVADFNAAYGTNLPASAFVYTQNSGWAYTYQRYMAIAAAPYTVNDRHSFIRYNADAGLNACTTNCDFNKGQSVDYFYPDSFDTASREMKRVNPESLHQAPSPGAVKTGQVPPKPVTQEAMPIAITKNTVNYDKYLGMSTPGPIIPGLNQDYIVQGADYYAAKDWILLSYYSDKGAPSILAAVDKATGQLVKYVRLYKDPATAYTEHAAGVALSTTNGWITSWKYLYQFKLADFVAAVNGDKLIFDDAIELENKAGAVGIDNGIVWVSEYGRYNYETDPAHAMTNRDGRVNKAWMAGFRLNAADTVDRTRLRPGTSAVVPNYIISVPDEVQGVEVSGDKFIVSKSYGPEWDSELLVYQINLNGTPNATTSRFGSPSVPVWYMDHVNLVNTIMMPPQSEGLFSANGTLYVSFENAAPKYMTGYASIYPIDRLMGTPLSAVTGAPKPIATMPGALLITETVLSSSSNNAYRYVELYNNSSSAIDLSGHQLNYYWRYEFADPWNYELLRYTLHDAGRGGGMTIPAHGTKIVWLLSDPSKTAADFNAAYGTSLAANQFVYVTGADWDATRERFLAIAGPFGDKDTDRYSFVRYNPGIGDNACVPATGCDAAQNQSIAYFYPATFDPVKREMERRSPASLHQTPTPGTVSTGQVPQ